MRVLGGALAGLALALGTAAPAVAVVGGQPAANQQFPWVVRLSVGCDGALVAPRVVLTAAHCVDHGPAVTVRAGSADLRGTVTARATAGLTAPGRVVGAGEGGSRVPFDHRRQPDHRRETGGRQA